MTDEELLKSGAKFFQIRAKSWLEDVAKKIAPSGDRPTITETRRRVVHVVGDIAFQCETILHRAYVDAIGEAAGKAREAAEAKLKKAEDLAEAARKDAGKAERDLQKAKALQKSLDIREAQLEDVVSAVEARCAWVNGDGSPEDIKAIGERLEVACAKFSATRKCAKFVASRTGAKP